MIRGTTPIHKWTLPVDASVVKKVRVVYSQDDETVFVKQTEDCILEGNDLKVTLTEEDTLKFSHKKKVEVQARFLTVDNKIFGTRVVEVPVWKLLDEEVMT